ncbi:MAG: phenylacetate--CoA ligase family protein [Planctomycetota bacterium]
MTTCLEKINLTLTAYYNARQFIKRQTSPDQLKKIQNEKLQKLVKHCYENIKYYRELFDKHYIRPKQIKTVKSLCRIPILTKKELRERFWDFLPKELPPCRVSRTSGSTGIPVCILSDRSSRLFNSASVIRYRKALGIPIIGRPILTPLKTENEPEKEPHWTFMQGIHRTYYINPYIDNTGYEIRLLEKLRRPVIIGITPAIRALAYKIRDSLLPTLKPIAVLTTGEYLSQEVRELLEDTFKTKITDIYACNEAGDIAWQCKKGQLYHINADNCIVEILKDGKPAEKGQTGEVVITNLNRYSMPFIRYKNGDLARFGTEDCRCGCKLPVISDIEGRTGEDIYLPNGKTIPWNQLKGFMNHPDVRQFQLVQNKDASLTVKFVPEDKSNIKQTKNILTSRFKGLLGDSVRIDIFIVERIDPAPSGKSKLVICHYDPPN